MNTNEISPFERLNRALAGKSLDRPPVICPGGMMNSATVEVMDGCGELFPEVHHSAEKMAKLVSAVQTATGFENFGVPFCMTVEAEVLGSEIDFGTRECEPKIAKEIYASVKDVPYRDIKYLIRLGRIEKIFKACQLAQATNQDIPIIATLTGPVSTAASVVDPLQFFKEMRRAKEETHRFLNYVTDFLLLYAQGLIESGVKTIAIADPTATGEILGPRMFAEYATPYLRRLVEGIHAAGAQAIVHICGRVEAVEPELIRLGSDAVSTDAMVSLKNLKAKYRDLTVMGNLSTFSLQLRDEVAIQRSTEKLLGDGIDIIAPACGLSTLTPLKNIRAMTGTVCKA